MIIRLDAVWLSEITDHIGLGEEGYSYIINNKGILISHNNREFVIKQKNFIDESKTKPEYTEIAQVFQKMIKGESGFSECSFMGSESVLGYAPIEGTTWLIAVGADKKILFRHVYSMQMPLVIFSVLILLISIIISLLISRNLVRPIQETTKMLKDLSEGSGDLTKRLNAKSNDEIGDIARYFNIFIEKLQSMIKTISVNAETVASSAVELSSVSSSGTKDVARNVAESAKGLSDVSKAIGNVSNIISETAQKVSHVKLGTDDLSKLSENLKYMLSQFKV